MRKKSKISFQRVSNIRVQFFCSFALTQKNQKVKAARILLKSVCIPLKGLKLASLKQSPLLNAPFRLISSRKIHEANLWVFLLWWGFGAFKLCFACFFASLVSLRVMLCCARFGVINITNKKLLSRLLWVQIRFYPCSEKAV